MKVTKKQKQQAERITTIAVLVLLAVGLLVGAAVLAWRATQRVPADVARAWALLATVAIPGAMAATWHLALRYTQGIVTGIDWGIGKVAQAGHNAADLKVHVHRELKREPDQYVVLPDVEISQRRLPSGNGEVIEL